MATVKSENWDGVTAPALPAGWIGRSDSGGPYHVTETTLNWSVPNAVTNAAAGDDSVLYWDTADDGNGGYAQASAIVFFSTAASVLNCSVFCRMTTAATAVSGLTSYWVDYDLVGGTFTLNKTVVGTTTQLGSLSVTPSSSDGYRVQCSCVGSQIVARMNRQSDNKWLRSDGTWQFGAILDAITVTDGSITGAGKAGVRVIRGVLAGDKGYSDNFLFETVSAPPVGRRRSCSSFT